VLVLNMKRLSFIAFFLLVTAGGLEAQWLDPQTALLKQGDFDRPHPAHRHSEFHQLSIPQAGLPNWPFPNIDVTNSPDSDQTEPSISINPKDSNNIIIGSNDDRTFNALWAYSSNDGGQTWLNQALPPVQIESDYLDATDPSIAFGSSGDAYFGTGHYFYGVPEKANDVACFRSTDSGANWSVAGYPFLNATGASDTMSDKYFISVDADAGSPFHNRIYATWMELVSPFPSRVACSFSSDGGQTWSNRIHLTGQGYFTAPVPAVAPNGTIIVTFENYTLDSTQILAVHSTDGGVTFSAPQIIAVYNDVGPWRGDTATNDGYPVVKDTVRANSFPSIAFDHSPTHNGRAYVAWCGKDKQGMSRVFLSNSDDGGVSWSSAETIDGDFSNIQTDKFFSWVAVDPVSGDVAVDYYDSRLDTNNILCDLFMSLIAGGGNSVEVRRISSASTDPRIGRDDWTVSTPHGLETFQFFGDYIGLAGRDSTWYATWTDGRSGNDLDIYSSQIQPYAPMPVTNLIVRDTIVNGKPAAILSWTYLPVTTFGYLLPAGLKFQVQKNDSLILLQNYNNKLRFLDTNVSSISEYEVNVISGRFHSITDSVQYLPKAGVGSVLSNSSIRFVSEPAVVGREDRLIVDCGAACSVTLLLYDELGREVGPPISDENISLHHEFLFTPERAGATFYVVKESSTSGSKEFVGKISTIVP
jgi:hypothetical protein